MGASGAGKTSLLNILAGRVGSNKKVSVSSDIRLNNYTVDPTDIKVRKMVAFVAQEESLMTPAIAWELIYFSAKLRLPRTTTKSQLCHLTIPFSMDGCISYLPIRTPTEWELKDCPKIWLTDSVRTWDPQLDLLAQQQESTYSVTQGRKVATVRALRSDDEVETSLNNSAFAIDRDPFYGKLGRLHDEETARVKKISRVSTDNRRLGLDPTQLQRRFGGVSLDVINNTLRCSMLSFAKAQTRHANAKLVHKIMLSKANFNGGSNEASAPFFF
jgi:ABC-type sugar transport system ATPase subunit